MMIHSIKVAFESIQVNGPEPAEPSQPGIQFFKWFRFQPVETALCVHRRFHETGLAQHSQVLRHGWLRHTKLALDLSHRLLGRDQETQYSPTVRLRNDFEDRFHSLHIPQHAYTCQGIYRLTFSAKRVPSEVVLNEEDGMKSGRPVNLQNAVTVSQRRLGKRVARLVPHERMRSVLLCASL